MTREETLKIMAVLKAAYPSYYKDLTREDAETAVSLWQSMFADQPYDLVALAVRALIAGSKWPPTIAEVNEKIALLTTPPAMTEMEAWALVSKALRNSGYESRKEFEALPAEIQRVLGSPSILREWAMLPSDQVETVVSSNFMRSYRSRVATAREYERLPGDVKKAIQGVSSGFMQLEGGVE